MAHKSGCKGKGGSERWKKKIKNEISQNVRIFEHKSQFESFKECPELRISKLRSLFGNTDVK